MALCHRHGSRHPLRIARQRHARAAHRGRAAAGRAAEAARARVEPIGSPRSRRRSAGKALRRLLADHPALAALMTGLADGSPYLWDLARRRAGAARRAARGRAGPPLRRHARRRPQRDRRHARRSRGDAALARHEGGGGAADRARRYRRRMAGHARGRSADPARRRGRRCGGAITSLRERRAAASSRPPSRTGRARLRLYRARHGQDGRGRAQLFERHRSHRVLRRRMRRRSRHGEPAPFTCGSRAAW